MAESSNEVVADSAEIPQTKEKLDELTQAASLQYSLKNFAAAAEHYSHAVEIQAAINGEMAPENAELLFHYGRALYKVAIAQSDVLGSKVATEEKKKKTSKAKKQESGGEASSASNGASVKEEKEDATGSKPYFQLTGMDAWSDSEEEEEDEQDGEAQDAEQDDFNDSFEMFEIARVLYHKQLEALDAGETADKGKGKAELSPKARAIKTNLSDIYGFLTDLSFENERFHDAIPDARTSLNLLEELYPFEHEKVTSAHYTLSLALEFASMSKIREQQANQDTTPANDKSQDEDVVDWDLRNEAAKHTELAIQSQEAHLKIAEVKLASDDLTPEKKKEMEAELEDKKSMVEDLKTRLADLKADPTQQKVDSIDPTVFQGLLGGLLGADPETQKAKLAEATKGANDLSGLVRTKKKAKPEEAAASSSATGEASGSKRKLEADDGVNGKRAKTEEMQ